MDMAENTKMFKKVEGIEEVSPKLFTALESVQEISLKLRTALESVDEMSPKLRAALARIREILFKLRTALASVDQISPKTLTALKIVVELSPKLRKAIVSINEICAKLLTALEIAEETSKSLTALEINVLVSSKLLKALERKNLLSSKLLPRLKSVGELSRKISSIKHPLQYTWTFWYFDDEKHISWEEHASFDTAEGFWRLYKDLKSIPDLKKGCYYGWFKKGIQPFWKDEAIIDGGRWVIAFDGRPDIDKYWLKTLLCLIGEGFEEFSSDICGAVLLIGEHYNISLLTGSYKNKIGIMEIGHIFKKELGIPSVMKITYQIHKDIQQQTGSAPKNTYTL